MKKNLVVGVLALVFAGIYYYLSNDIHRSLLSDQVGADGLPKLYAMILGVLGIALTVKSLAFRTASAAKAEPASETVTPLGHLRAMGLLGLGVAYLLLISKLGYLVTIFLLLIAVTVYCGAKLNLRLLLINAAGSVVFWLVFAKMFSVSLPSGTLWQ